MRMRTVAPGLTCLVLCLSLLGGLAPSAVRAATTTTPTPPPPPPTPSRAPIGAPPAANSDELNGAYAFRNKMSSDPACQELASQSDRIYADPKMESGKKQAALEQLNSRAKAAGCL